MIKTNEYANSKTDYSPYKTKRQVVNRSGKSKTIGDIIIFRPDATTSEVLEEIHHFYQNRAALNNQYGEDQRRVMNELDTLEYLLSVSDKYKIPAEEIEETKLLQEFYRNKKERLKREGEWID